MTSDKDNYVSQLQLSGQAIWIKDAEAREAIAALEATVASGCRFRGNTGWNPDSSIPHLVDGEIFYGPALFEDGVRSGDIVLQNVYKKDEYGQYVKEDGHYVLEDWREEFIIDVRSTPSSGGSGEMTAYFAWKFGGGEATVEIIRQTVADYMRGIACYTPTGSVNVNQQIVPTGSISAFIESDAEAQVDASVQSNGEVRACFTHGTASVSGSVTAQGCVTGTAVCVRNTTGCFANTEMCLDAANEILNVFTSPIAYVSCIEGADVTDPTFMGCSTNVELFGCATGTVEATFEGGVSTISCRAPVSGSVKGCMCADPLCVDATFCGDPCTIQVALEAKTT